jgi:Leucine-rich repeat (LRR) protein
MDSEAAIIPDQSAAPKARRSWFHLRIEIFVVIVVALIFGLIDYNLLANSVYLVIQGNAWDAIQIFILLILLGETAIIVILYRLIKCRRFQYSLRTLFIVVTLFAIACSCIAVVLQNAKGQRDAVEAIKKAQGYVTYDFWDDAEFQGKKGPPGPAWLRALLGDYYFSDVVSVSGNLTDVEMVHLKRLTKLRKLKIWMAYRVSDAGLAYLKGLTELQILDLSSCSNISDAGIVHLKGLTKLQKLDLSSTQVTDVGLENIKGLTNLQELNLSHTQVTDVGLEHIKKLTNLQELYLFETKITDEGLRHLKALKKLTRIFLWKTQVTDAGVQDLKKALPNLIILNEKYIRI